ncbi:MAG TPA: DUF6624 domain-containing protein, partial [Blastocatellia bacterium]|nr:DUF6624 domain-containing protein [Blastocatellia bacterium]
MSDRGAIDHGLRRELLEMAAEDMAAREELASDGALFEGYHPRMEAVHRRNSARLSAIIDERGWPGVGLAGDDGEDAAWIILQHSIGEPAFQRRGLKLLKGAAARGEAPPWQAAYLEDRIRACEGRPQIYGTQYGWDESGEMSPCPPIEDEENVNERRRAVGLGTLEENLARVRAGVAASSEKPPSDPEKRRREEEEWARS